MRKLKLQVQISVDGFIAGPNGEMDWMAFPWTEDIGAYVGGLVEKLDTIVLGRKLAEGFIPHWAAVAADPNNPEVEAGHLFTNTPKIVFSRTLTESPWDNTRIGGELGDEIRALKNQEGGDIYAYGGAGFVSSLIAEGLIDEYHLFVNPAAIGTGLSIFGKLASKQSLQLIKASTFDCGIVVLHYAVKREEA